MRNRYKIPEIRAVQLLGCMTEEAFTKQLPEFNTADASREVFMKWTMQDECPMFHLAETILWERANDVNPAFREDDLSRVFVYIDFSGIFDRQPVGKIAELQRKAELMFRPEGIPLMIDWKPARYIAFERSASMSRNSKLCFVREDMYEVHRRRMMLDTPSCAIPISPEMRRSLQRPLHRADCGTNIWDTCTMWSWWIREA